MLYELIRPLTCPFDQIEPFVPKKGKILDVGCGHGLFAKLLSDKSKKRTVIGVDPSKEKINQARKINGSKNLKFVVGHLSDIKGKFDCITEVDVLYLFPENKKLEFLKECSRHLKKNGRLILVENGDGESLIFKILRIQENIMTTKLKFTYTDYKGIHFLDKAGYSKLIKNSGFVLKKQKDIKSFLPYPHVVFVSEKP